MIIETSETERKLLLSLKEGFSQILIYKYGSIPNVVSFVLKNNKTVTIQARSEDIGPRFEVFPIFVTEDVFKSEPAKIIEREIGGQQYSISILQKSEWSVPSSEKEKAQMLGDPVGSTTQFEGKSSDVPDNAIERVALHSGVEIKSQDGWSFLTATSISLFALYVSDCDFSEPYDPAIYERIALN